MFIIKWVELDDLYNNYPAVILLSNSQEAKEKFLELEKLSEEQQSQMEELFVGKIVSEIYIEEYNHS